MGPKSRALLQGYTDADLSNRAFPFATSQKITVNGISLRATRISFVGSLGWELYIPTETASIIVELLMKDAMKPQPIGLFAVDCCRMEMGYLHWGHDIGPEETPLMAGLGFLVDWDKSDFIGRNALIEQMETGNYPRLMKFELPNKKPLLLHDEPIYRDGICVGRTTSGQQGFRTGKTLCMGYVTDHKQSGDYTIKVAGYIYPLRPIRNAMNP